MSATVSERDLKNCNCSASEKERGLTYVDIVGAMLRADGTPDPELFVKDGLHMTPKGYEIWTAAVNRALK